MPPEQDSISTTKLPEWCGGRHGKIGLQPSQTAKNAIVPPPWWHSAPRTAAEIPSLHPSWPATECLLQAANCQWSLDHHHGHWPCLTKLLRSKRQTKKVRNIYTAKFFSFWCMLQKRECLAFCMHYSESRVNHDPFSKPDTTFFFFFFFILK